MDNEVKFVGTMVRKVYDGDDYKIYGLNVSKEKYPDIKQNKYKNVTITGLLPELSEGMAYEVTAVEEQSKYGYCYKWEHYPDIVQRVKENRLNDVNLSKLKGIKEKTFAKIVDKITENYCLADLVIEFQGYFTMPMLKKLYTAYPSVELLKQRLQLRPYTCLTALAGVGFKTADSLLLDLEALSKKNIEEGKLPIIEFDGDLRSSYQRCLSCVIYLLQENENEGHTKMSLVDLREAILKLVPACSDHFVEVIKHKWIYYNKDTLDVALKWTYNTEKYITETVLSTLKSKQILWEFDIEKYREVDGMKLTDEQLQAVGNVCKYNISILNGASGVGKSSSVQAVIRMLDDNDISYVLFAPTGKQNCPII